MNQILLEKVEFLKAEITNNSDVVFLNKLEEKINNSEEVMRLSYKMDIANTNYEDSIKHFGENSDETKNAQRALHQAKLELDLHPLVKEYNLAYSKVRELYDLLNTQLFKEFFRKECHD